jgi:hypothetical protein
MSPDQLREVLAHIHSAMIVSLTAHTVPILRKRDMRKRDNPYIDRVTKVSRVNGVICWGYARAVNRQRLREDRIDDFEAAPRPWGRRIRGTPLVEHNGRYYLEMKVQSRQDMFLVDGQPSDVDLSPWLPRRCPSRQEVTKEVVLRDFALASIREIRWAGRSYEIELPQEANTQPCEIP